MLRKFKLVNRKSFLIKDKYQLSRIKKFPCIIKPNDGTGSMNVIKIENKKSLISTVNYLLKDKVKILFEEFVEGKEYSLEVFF